MTEKIPYHPIPYPRLWPAPAWHPNPAYSLVEPFAPGITCCWIQGESKGGLIGRIEFGTEEFVNNSFINTSCYRLNHYN